MTKSIDVFFAKKSFGYSIWANIGGKSPKAFVHAKTLETGIKNIQIQLNEALGGERAPVEGTIETMRAQEESGVLDDFMEHNMGLATQWVQSEIEAA